MKDRPILFSGEMVRAILEGRKTQTRRVIKFNHAGRIQAGKRNWHVDDRNAIIACPYGVPGDRLWVRETWRITGGFADTPIRELNPAYKNNLQFRADRDESYIDKYHPSIFMPRWASRITLDVVNVRVERVQDIWLLHRDKGINCFDELFREGIPQSCTWDGIGNIPTPLSMFISLWDSINAKRGYGWATNPWVWVIEFK